MAAVVVVVVLAGTGATPVVVAGTMKALVATPVRVAPPMSMVPVHEAPRGQHATLPAWSSWQSVPAVQQTPAALSATQAP